MSRLFNADSVLCKVWTKAEENNSAKHSSQI
jgi:hypothetical protein